MRKLLIISLFLISLFTPKVVAQEHFEVVLEKSINRVNELLDSSNVFLLKNKLLNQNYQIPGFLFLSGDISSEKSKATAEQYYELKKKFLKSDLGIKVIGNYNNNLKGGFAEDEDIFYSQRTYVGMEWNALETGSFKNRKKVDAISNEQQITQIELKEENLKKDFFFTRQYLTASFVNAQNPYLTQRLEVLWGLYDISQELYYLKRVNWEKLIEIKAEIKKVELMLARNKQILDYSGFQKNELLQIDNLPIFGLNTDNVIKGIPLHEYDSLKYAIQKNNLKNQYDTYIDKASLRPYIRYNFYDFLSYQARHYPSVGVSMSLPINKRNNKDDLVKVEKQLIDEQYEEEKDELFSEVLLKCRLYEEKVQDFVYLVYQRDMLKEQISQELRKREISLFGFNGIKALGFFDEFLNFETQILDKKKDLYLRLLDICYESKGEDPNLFLTQLEYDLSFKKFPGQRSVFIWSELFNVMRNDHLITFLQDREIKEVLISVGKAVDRNKLMEFVSESEHRNLKVVGLISNNELVKHSDDLVLSYLKAFESLPFKSYHFNIEPHVYADFRPKEEMYLQKLLHVYNLAHQWANKNNLELSASVPYHYPLSFIQEATSDIDKIYIMNYGAKDESILLKRLEKFNVPELKKKLVVVIRPNDFASLKALDYSLLHISKESGFNNYSFSDLRGLNRMLFDISDDINDAPEYSPYRVETGTFANKQQAEFLASNIKKMGYKGDITWKRNGSYCVVLGYFNNFESARKTVINFKAKQPDLPEPWVFMVH